MEVVTGALPSVISKLGELLVGEYKLQKGVKGEIRFLQSELESMKGALEKLSNTPIDELDIQDKIWARELRELSYDIEDNIDIFMICGKGNEAAQLRGIKKFIDRSVGLFRKVKVRHGIATEIRDIKIRVEEVAKRNDRYKIIRTDAAKPVTIDPRLLTQYTEVRDLVGIDEARDELIKTLEKENQVSMQQHGKIVSIVGFGGLGKTTIANVVYEKIRAQFDCCAFVSVSQTPDLKKLFMALLNNLGKNTNEETLDVEHLIRVLREFLHQKRHLHQIQFGGCPFKMAKKATSRLKLLGACNMQGCNLSKANILQGLGNLYHLRATRVPNGIGNLSCLQRLSYLLIDDSTVNIIEELGRLTELRLLHIKLEGKWNEKLLVESLRKLQKIKELCIWGKPNQHNIGGLDTWVAPRHLHALHTKYSCWFSTLRSWLNPSLLVDLTRLDIAVREMHQVDLEVLGRLSALRSLDLEVDNKKLGILRGFIVGAGWFPCLVFCYLRGFIWPVVFEQGAMPRLRELWCSFHVLEVKGIASSDVGLDLGLGNLPSLQKVSVLLQYDDASKEAAEHAEAALRHAAEMHPNRPHAYIRVEG